MGNTAGKEYLSKSLKAPLGHQMILTKEEAEVAFDKYDANKNGSLEFVEARAFFLDVIEILRKRGHWLFEGNEEEMIQYAFKTMDVDHNGTLSKREFLTHSNWDLWPVDKEKEWMLSSAFDFVDKDGSGSITKAELTRWMEATLGAAATHTILKFENEREVSALEETFRRADKDKSGQIDRDEFVQYFSKGDLKHIKHICQVAFKLAEIENEVKQNKK